MTFAARTPSYCLDALDLCYKHMPRRLHNWSYRDVTDFLRENGFSFLKELGGSHQAWIKRGVEKGEDTVVELNFTHASYCLQTLKMIIYDSRIREGEWIKWGNG